MPAFCPVPLSVPVDPGREPTPIPSAGPYYIASIEGHSTVLERNRNYGGDRPRRSARIVSSNDMAGRPRRSLSPRGGRRLPAGDCGGRLLSPGGALDRRYGPGRNAARAGGSGSSFIHRAVRRHVRLQHAAAAVPRSSSAPRGQVRARSSRARSGIRGRAQQRIVPPAVPGFRGGTCTRSRAGLPAARGWPDNATALRPSTSAVTLDGSTLAQIGRNDLERRNNGQGGRLAAMSGAAPARRPAVRELLRRLERLELDPAPFIGQAVESADYGSPLGRGPWRRDGFRREVERARVLRGRTRLAAYRQIQAQLMRIAPVASSEASSGASTSRRGSAARSTRLSSASSISASSASRASSRSTS